MNVIWRGASVVNALGSLREYLISFVKFKSGDSHLFNYIINYITICALSVRTVLQVI